MASALKQVATAGRLHLRAMWALLSISVRVSPWQSLICLFSTLGTALQSLQVLFLAGIVVGVAHRDQRELIASAAAYVGSYTVLWVLIIVGQDAQLVMRERVGFAFDTRIAETTARIPTLDHLETPRYLDQLQILRNQKDALGNAFLNVLGAADTLTTTGVTIALAAAADWRLLIVAAGGFPMVASLPWMLAWQNRAERESAPPGRLTRRLFVSANRPATGSEIRVFGLARTLRQRVHSSATAWRFPTLEVARRSLLLNATCNLIFFGVAGGVLVWIIHNALDGHGSIGVITLALMLVGRLQSVTGSLVGVVQNIGSALRTTRRYIWLIDYEKDVHDAHPVSRRPPTVLQEGIRLDHVSYTYPDTSRPSISDLSLDLAAGTVVALVGDNGAGKSTLVKLLTGMYRPTSGRILVDGIDLADIDLPGWREATSAAFQDYARLELTMLESVGIGSLPHVHDERRVQKALSDAASESLLDVVPDGLATQLGITWPGGAELSGGQWQRLAIARGIMRDQPLLLVLDEPTAALDATTEHALFEQYARTAHEAGRRGALTILVTHRFSTVAAADLVVVLEHGRIIEMGTHDRLMAAGGHYADLYGLQARGYR